MTPVTPRVAAAMVMGERLYFITHQHDYIRSAVLPPGFTQAHIAHALQPYLQADRLVLVSPPPATHELSLWNGQRATRLTSDGLGRQLGTTVVITDVPKALVARMRSLAVVPNARPVGLMLAEDHLGKPGGVVQWFMAHASGLTQVPVRCLANTADGPLDITLERPLSQAEVLLADMLEQLPEHYPTNVACLWLPTPLSGWYLGVQGIFWRQRRTKSALIVSAGATDVLHGAALIGLGTLFLPHLT